MLGPKRLGIRDGRIGEAVEPSQTFANRRETRERDASHHSEALLRAVLEIVVLRTRIGSRRHATPVARVDQRHHAPQAHVGQWTVTRVGALEGRFARESFPVAKPPRGIPELLSVQPVRTQVAHELQIRIADAVQKYGQPYLLDGRAFVQQRCENPAACKTQGVFCRGERCLSVEKDKPGGKGERLGGDHAREFEEHGGPGCPVVSADVLEALVVARVVGREQQDEVRRRSGNDSHEVGHPQRLLARALDVQRLLMDFEAQRRELLANVCAGTLGSLGSRASRPGGEDFEIAPRPGSLEGARRSDDSARGASRLRRRHSRRHIGPGLRGRPEGLAPQRRAEHKAKEQVRQTNAHRSPSEPVGRES